MCAFLGFSLNAKASIEIPDEMMDRVVVPKVDDREANLGCIFCAQDSCSGGRLTLKEYQAIRHTPLAYIAEEGLAEVYSAIASTAFGHRLRQIELEKYCKRAESDICTLYAVGNPREAKSFLRELNRNQSPSGSERAASLFLYAYERGCLEATFNLGRCYLDGTGVKDNEYMALRLFEKSAQPHRAEDFYQLGLRSMEREYGYSLTEGYALNLFKIADKLGHAKAKVRVGRYYEFKRGHSGIVEAFIPKYHEAHRQGCVEGTHNLARCNEYGITRKRNPVRAFELYQEAAEKGYTPSISSLANCYENGIGVEKDIKKAIELYEQLAAQNHTFASYRLYCLAQKKPANDDKGT